MTVYVDSSFVVSIYVQDNHSAGADRFFRSEAPLSITPLHIAEFAHAIAQHAFRGQVSGADVDRLHRDFNDDCSAGLWGEVAMPEQAFERCTDLARRYGSRLGIRTLDSLHVASAMELKAERFWTFDDRQAKLAKLVGLKS